MSSNPYTRIYVDYGGGDHENGRLGLRMDVWLQDKGRGCGLRLRPRLNAGPVCNAQRHWGGIVVRGAIWVQNFYIYISQFTAWLHGFWETFKSNLTKPIACQDRNGKFFLLIIHKVSHLKSWSLNKTNKLNVLRSLFHSELKTYFFRKFFPPA